MLTELVQTVERLVKDAMLAQDTATYHGNSSLADSKRDEIVYEIVEFVVQNYEPRKRV